MKDWHSNTAKQDQLFLAVRGWERPPSPRNKCIEFFIFISIFLFVFFTQNRKANHYKTNFTDHLDSLSAGQATRVDMLHSHMLYSHRYKHWAVYKDHLHNCLFIQLSTQPINASAAQCIKSCRQRSGASVDVNNNRKGRGVIIVADHVPHVMATV